MVDRSVVGQATPGEVDEDVGSVQVLMQVRSTVDTYRMVSYHFMTPVDDDNTMWFLLALGMDLALVAVAPAIRMGPVGLLVAVLCNPLEAGRVLALLAASPDGTVLGPFGAYLVESFGSAGASAILVGSLVFWVAAPLLVARWIIARSDM